MEIFKLFGSIMVDSAEANKSIAKTEKSAEGMGKKLASSVKTVTKWAAGLTTAAAAVGAAMVASAKGVASDLDVIDKGSQRMGLTAERYQELAYAASLCGVDMATMEEAAKKLSEKDINLDTALKNIMSIKDGATRTQAAIDMFGESAYQLAPLLAAGTDGLREMTDEAHTLGLVMSNDAVSAGAEMNDLFSKVAASVKAAGQSVIIDLFPYIKEVLEWILKAVPQARETISNVAGNVIPIVKAVFDWIMNALPPIQETFQTVIDALLPLLEPVLEMIGKMLSSKSDSIKRLLPPILEAFRKVVTALLPLLEPILDKIKSLAASASSVISSLLPPILDAFTSVVGTLLPVLKPVLAAIQTAVTALADTIERLLPPILEAFQLVVDSLLPLLEPVVEQIGNVIAAAAEVVTALLPPILDAFASVVEALLPLLEPVLAEINAAVTTAVEVVSALLPPIVEVFSTMVGALMPVLTPVLEAIKIAVAAVTTAVQTAIDFVQPYLEPVIEAIKALISGFLALLNGDIKGFADGIVAYFTGMISVVTDLGKKIFTGLWDGMKSVWANISGWIEGVVSSITDWFSGIGAKIAGFFGFDTSDTDGSHAAGLPTVPYDGYKAQLHRGETVLNANDTSRLAELLQNGITADAAPINITVQNVLDGKVIGQYSYQYNRRKARALG